DDENAIRAQREAAAKASRTPTPLEVTDEGVRFGRVLADPKTRTIRFPAWVNMTNGLLEYVVVTDYGKTHESLLVTEARPVDVQSALLLLNARAGGTNSLKLPDGQVPRRCAVSLRIQWSAKGENRSAPL